MESRVLPSKDVSALLTKNFVALKVDIDKAPADVQKYLSQVGGNTLPFYAYVGPDGKFIKGTSGFRDEKAFLDDLESVVKIVIPKASPADEKKLAKAVEQAEKDLEAGRLAAVVKAAREAEKVRGLSEAKDRLKELQTKAEEAGAKGLDEAVALAKEGKYDDALTAVKRLASDFKGAPLEEKAAVAQKSLERLKSAEKFAEKGEKTSAKKLCDLIVKEAAGTPWAAMAAEKGKGLQ